MIRDTRAFVAVNAAGALLSLMLFASWLKDPPPHQFFPLWFIVALPALMFGGFVYQIVMKLTGRPIPLAWWVRGKTDRQIWTVKYVLLACILVYAVALIFHPR